MRRGLFIGLLFAIIVWNPGRGTFARAAENIEGTTLIPEFGLVLTRAETSGERAQRRFSPLRENDPVRARLIDGTLSQYRPVENETPEGLEQLQWKRVAFEENGAVKERGYYLYAPIDSAKRQVLVLHASGQSETYASSEPRGGDVYNTGYVHLPVPLAEGVNPLFFRAGRGQFKVRLYEPPSPVFLHQADKTLPDLVQGQPIDMWGAVIVINATPDAVEDLTLQAKAPGLADCVTRGPTIPALSIRKVGFRIQGPAPSSKDAIAGTLELGRGDEVCQHSIPLELKVVAANERRRITFVSQIDGSVQYYSLRPADPQSPDDPTPALVLSCHGASVEAHGQSGAYSTKDWFHIVAPTNRRPYGFDWEDFGRMDAIEVLELAQASLDYDPARVYLTGHSMGGHGTWHLGVTFPDRFAAIGPSAGWLSRSSYGRRRSEETEESPMTKLLNRSKQAGDTIALSANLKQHGVYILHGADDDNVPASQAQKMTGVLKEFHHDWFYHAEPGKRHWWGNDYNDGGSACVDWPFMFDLFARHALPPTNSVRNIEFVTANPGVSSSCHWLGIEGQIHHADLSRVAIHTWPTKRRFQGATENVAVLRLDVRHLRSEEPITVELDGQTLENIPYPTESQALWLQRTGEQWRCVPRPSLKHKGPHRYGAVKDELRHRVLLIYGTDGTPEENTWASGKARFDAETLWYRGNGAVEIVADSDFAPARYPDRTVVLYGNADTNRAWSVLLGDCPIKVRRGSVRVGDRSFEGADISALFVQPRGDSDVASVVVVSGSGPVGMRSTYLTPLFVPAVRYPDCLIRRVSGDTGTGSDNLAAGYFGLDWSVEAGELVFAPESI